MQQVGKYNERKASLVELQQKRAQPEKPEVAAFWEYVKTRKPKLYQKHVCEEQRFDAEIARDIRMADDPAAIAFEEDLTAWHAQYENRQHQEGLDSRCEKATRM